MPGVRPKTRSRSILGILCIMAGGCCPGQKCGRDGGVKPSRGRATPAQFDSERVRIANALANKYAEAPYITFRAHIETHESLVPGWKVKPGAGIAPGTVFEGVMSANGDMRVRMLVNDNPVYEWQVAVQSNNSGAGPPAKQYLVREFDHVNRVRAEDRIVEGLPRTMPLVDEVLDHAAWCSSGGFMKPLVGPAGRVADPTDDNASAYRITHGSFLRRQRLRDGREVDVFKFVRDPPADAYSAPNGEEIPARPAIWFASYVDVRRNLVALEDAYIEFSEESPILTRRKRFTDVQFPTQVDEEREFRAIPEEARSYRVWKPGEPYPVAKRSDASGAGDGGSK